MGKHFIVQKASGEKEDFSKEKLGSSLRRAGVSDAIANRVITQVRREAGEAISSSDIHRRVMGLLRKEAYGYAARYNLKRAIMELGPTGHPFEKFVADIMRAEGYVTQTNLIVQGRCVTHEVDVVGRKGERRIMMECKFHNQPGTKTDVKIAMYVHSRFEDIEGMHRLEKNYVPQFHEAWLVTNTTLTSDAIRFARCTGMKAIGWNYPQGGNLQDMIERSGLQPVTSLITPTREEKQTLVEGGIVLAKQIRENKKIMTALGILESHAVRIQEEAQALLTN